MTSLLSPDAVRQIVTGAWGETLNRALPDPRHSWEEAGADSLKSLHLALRLERALGRPVSLDLLSHDMTIDSLAAALSADAADDATLPTIYLVPGVFGDGPELAGFRRAFKGHYRFELVDLPDLDQPIDLLCSIPETGRLLADDILRRAGDRRPIIVAGWSFGAGVAAEAVRHLISMRCDVSLFVNIDGVCRSDAGGSGQAWPAPPDADRRADTSRFRKAPGESMSDYLARAAVPIVLALGRHDLARRLTLALRHRVTPELAVRQRRHVLGHCRGRALAAWTPLPLAVPMVLALTDEMAALGSEARWRAVSPMVEVVRLAGRHHDLFQPATMAQLVPALSAAIDRGLQP